MTFRALLFIFSAILLLQTEACAHSKVTLAKAPPALRITTTSLPSGVQNSAYVASLNASGGKMPYAWSAQGLPSGIVAAGSQLGGTPTVSGGFSVALKVIDRMGKTANSTLGLTITLPPPPPPPPPPVAHSVSLNWTASTSTNVSGYNVYRAPQSGGPYTKSNIMLIGTTTYIDATVQSGQTYYYIATAVDSSSNESTYSNEVRALVPSP